jgi:hypothetical protein
MLRQVNNKLALRFGNARKIVQKNPVQRQYYNVLAAQHSLAGDEGGLMLSSCNVYPRAPTTKNFSSSAFRNKRAFPAYTVFGETAVLTMQPIMPKFEFTGQDDSIIRLSQQGRMMFQFSPSSRTGIQWNKKIILALNVEELGLLVSQLPFHAVTFTRDIVGNNGDGMNEGRYNTISDDDSVVKTLSVTPLDGASIRFEIDYKKNGVGGQVPPNGTNENNFDSAPMHITVQAGEWEVLKSLAQESLPSLLGWKKLMDIATENEITYGA